MSVQLPTQAPEDVKNDVVLDRNDDVPNDGPGSEDEVPDNLEEDGASSSKCW